MLPNYKIKGKETVSERDLKGLKLFEEEFPRVRKIVVSLESVRRIREGIEIWPASEFLAALWNGKVI